MGLMSRVPSGYEGRFRRPFDEMGSDPRMGMQMQSGMVQGGMMQPGDPPQMQNPLMLGQSPTTMPAPAFTPTQLFSLPMPQGVDPGLAALGQTSNGMMPTMTQGAGDAAAAAYGGGNPMAGFGSMMQMMQMGQQKQPQIPKPAPPPHLDPRRFMRGR